MSNPHPDPETLDAALALTVRAPSVRNTQPWMWRVGDCSMHLYADTTRHLPHTDPDGRDLVISCGAALHHFRIAARALGWGTTIHRLPNPADPDHLAAIEFRDIPPSADAMRLARAITRRRTDRRRYTSSEVPDAHVATIVAAAGANGVLARDIEAGHMRTQLLRAFEQAAAAQSVDPAYNAELVQWSGRHAAPQDVPARNAVLTPEAVSPRFSTPGLSQAVVHDIDEDEHLLLLSTSGDDRVSQLRAGEATSAALLTATALGLATCPLTEPLEVPAARARIRTDVLDDSGFPQLVVRMGWAAPSSDPLPITPRRPPDDVVRPW